MDLMLKDPNKPLNLQDYTVIIPSVCVGNAAQLAVDLLIASKELSRIGSIAHPALIPVFGPSAYDHEPGEKLASCELYESKEDKLLVVQFRTPFISRYTKRFLEKFVKIVERAKRIIILSACFSFEKHVIGDSPYEYLCSENFEREHKKQLEKMKWKKFAGHDISGGGNAMKLYNALKGKTSVMLLFRYALDGDNSLDAKFIIKELNEVYSDFLRMSKKQGNLVLKEPVSWKLKFGNDVTHLMY